MTSKTIALLFFVIAVLLQGCAQDKSAETQPVSVPDESKSVVRPDGSEAPQNFNDAIKTNPNIPDSAKKAMLDPGQSGK